MLGGGWGNANVDEPPSPLPGACRLARQSWENKWPRYKTKHGQTSIKGHGCSKEEDGIDSLRVGRDWAI